MPVVSGTQYATRTDLANLGLIGNALASVPTGVQDAALLAASAMADSYLQSRFVLPVTSWGQDLVRIICIVAAYDIMTSRGYNPMAGADQNIRQRYIDALEWLDEVGKGTQSPSYIVDSNPGGSTTSTTSTDGSIVSSIDGELRIVTQSVRGWTPRGGTGGSWDNGMGSL